MIDFPASGMGNDAWHICKNNPSKCVWSCIQQHTNVFHNFLIIDSNAVGCSDQGKREGTNTVMFWLLVGMIIIRWVSEYLQCHTQFNKYCPLVWCIIV